MKARNTEQTVAMAAATQPAPAAPVTQPAPAAPLPTHGGLYEADPDTRALRAVEGGPPEEKPAQTPDATTGEQP